jgi:hypothetical protein
MKTLYSSLRLIVSGETALVVLSVALFLASLANRTQWPALRACRFCGTLTLFLSLAFCILSSMEIFKHQRRKRTIMAAVLFLAATVLCISGGRFVVNGGS